LTVVNLSAILPPES